MRHAVLLTLLCLVQASAWSEELPSCSALEVRYSAPTVVPLNNRVVVRRAAAKPTRVNAETDREFNPYSPQRTSAFNRVRVPNFTKPGPYETSIEIFTLSGESHAWEIDFSEHKNGVQLLWLNEELLFVRVWWGRILATDLIFQIGSGDFIYAREANYGLLVQPCK
jgi:hypothetical protein